ncbi:hypothetical protein DFR55_10884 [Herbinix hemicellulosilytica]|uniref:Uncharacterized protein n=1 Tax=Herbinix hemicellulosilytica TaxID=1564487 RepID=A0A0H5SGM3_HERHM|nr:hypothetical protein [Herbinix hemicellulosilytica]RBP59023.1 hypothetical protein DFR55_10884 [Herbinix hemicellulosilytica]CRZ33951.1 hypothetical protein HHT355_0748 [Herbinix hemicellulosilytica]
MNKRNVILTAVAVVALIAIIITSVIIIKKDDRKEKTERNYGISHIETNITSSGIEETKPEDAVPKKDQLIQNLEDKGYDIEYYDTVFDSDISCYRIYATKNNEFIDICYDLTEENAETAFYEYEKKYDKYYLMAMNGTFVYCISDKKVFKDAGFKSLANNGIQYINN